MITDIAPESILVEIYGQQFKWTARYSGPDNLLGEFDYKLTSDQNPLALRTAETMDASIYGLKNEIGELEAQLEESSNGELEEIKVQIEKKERLLKLLERSKEKYDKSMDESALNDFIVSDTLVLCKNQEYEFNFRSRDVIHSAYFPHFRAQMNVVPGVTTRFSLTAEHTTEEMRNVSGKDDFEYVLMCNKICGSGHDSMTMVVRVLEKEEYHSWLKKVEPNSFEKTMNKLKNTSTSDLRKN